eukprot:gene10530-12461_t
MSSDEDLYAEDVQATNETGGDVVEEEQVEEEQEADAPDAETDAVAMEPEPEGTAILEADTPDNSKLLEELATKETQIAELQRQVDQWRSAFRDETKPEVIADPGSVLDNLLALRASERKLHEQVRDYKKREDALVLRVQAKDQEIQDFKVYKLALDPAVHREFTRLQKELDDKDKALKASQADLESATYSADSKMGRRLRARLQTVLKENEELASQIKEGKVQRLETELAMLKDYLNEMKRLDRDLVDDAQMLDEESTELQQHLFVLQNRISQRDGFQRDEEAELVKEMQFSSALPPMALTK